MVKKHACHGVVMTTMAITATGMAESVNHFLSIDVYKRQRQYKVALFTEKIDDNISYSGTSGRWYAINEDFKSHGIEASIRGQEDNGFTWHAGLTWQDPKSKQTTEKTSAKRYCCLLYTSRCV